MKIRFAVFTLILLTSCSFVELSAQTKKPLRKKTPAAKSEATNKTRARRAGAPTPSEPATESPGSDDPKSADTTEKSISEPVVKPSSQTTETAIKPETPLPPTKPSEPTDPIATLRDQIDAASSGPERNRLQLKLVDELVSSGNKSAALSQLRTILNTDVFDPQGLYNVGNAMARLGDNDGAIDAYRKAIEQRKGRYSRAFNNLGVVFLRVGKWDEAYDALLTALKLENFRYAEASYNLGRLYAARGQNDLAVREWRRVLSIDPQHTAAADALSRVGSEDRVVVETNRTVSTPGASERPTGSAVIEKPVSPKPATSSARSPRSLVLDQESFNLLQTARAATEKGSTQESIDAYKKLLTRHRGYFPPANLELSFALLSLKSYEEAQANLQLVVDRDGPRYPISYFHLARVLELQGNLKQAEEFFSRASTSFASKNSQFLLDVSRVREKQGNFKGALEAMESYLSEMQKQGLEPAWSEERLTALRQKIADAPKP